MQKNFFSKASKPLFFSSLAMLLLTQSGCFGSFTLVKKLYTWNKSVTSNKFGQSIIFWVLNIIPVYGAASFVDVVFLNLIEFWTGSNPVTMTQGQREEKIVKANDGNTYKMIATKNQFEIVALSGKNSGKNYFIKFNQEEKSWAYADGKNIEKLCQFNVSANDEIIGVTFFSKEKIQTISVAEVENQYNSLVVNRFSKANNLAINK